MLDYLESLRQKPKSYRRKMAILISVGITAMIALVWIVTIPFSYGGKEKSKSVNEVNPWDGIGKASATLFKSLKQGAADVSGIFKVEAPDVSSEEQMAQEEIEGEGFESEENAGNSDENIVY